MAINNSFLFAVCSLLFSLNVCDGRDMPIDPNPFSTSDEAKVVIPKLFKKFITNPSHFVLGRIDYLCMKIPDDTRDGRDVKLTLMLQFMAMVDALREEKVQGVSGQIFIPPSWGLPPGATPEQIEDPVLRSKYAALLKEHDARVEHYIIQVMLEQFRYKYSKEIPGYIQYTYTASEKDHVQSIIREQLKNDPKGKDLLDSFLAAEPLLPPESIPAK